MAIRNNGYNPLKCYYDDPQLRGTIDSIATGYFTDGDVELVRPLVDSLLHDDQYLVLADYRSYIECSERAAAAYQDERAWTRMSILNTARCGFFSSDRTIQQYSDEIWRIRPVKP